MDEKHEQRVEKVRQGRYSVTVKPTEEFNSFAQLQVRESLSLTLSLSLSLSIYLSISFSFSLSLSLSLYLSILLCLTISYFLSLVWQFVSESVTMSFLLIIGSCFHFLVMLYLLSSFLRHAISTLLLSSSCYIYSPPFFSLLSSFPRHAISTLLLSSLCSPPFFVMLYLLSSFPRHAISSLCSPPFLVMLYLLSSFLRHAISTLLLSSLCSPPFFSLLSCFEPNFPFSSTLSYTSTRLIALIGYIHKIGSLHRLNRSY